MPCHELGLASAQNDGCFGEARELKIAEAKWEQI